MSTPDIEIGEIEGEVTGTTEVGETNSFEAQSTEFTPNPLSELVRNLNAAAESVYKATEHSLPGDRALLVGLCVQINAVTKLFIDSAEAMANAEESTETLEVED